ncbi:MAG: protein-ADP-ribose hydrolase [bacterium]|nr:protein-ADP-ribose hydrolase [bacterium]
MSHNSEQAKRLDYLLAAFKEDSIQYSNLECGNTSEEKRMAVRSLMNIRMPKAIDERILNIQDEFLQEEAKEKGIISVNKIPTVKEEYGSKKKYADQLSIWQGDITRLSADAIVNAANSQMLGCFVPCHKCIDNAIHSAAGVELREACNQYMVQKRKVTPMYEEPTGKAMVTLGFNLPAKYVIHTVGPIVQWRVTDRLRQDLKNCYISCLTAAMEKGIRSIAFCCISTGEFRFPNEDAAEIAVETVKEFLGKHEEAFDRVIFNVFKDVDKQIYESLLS